MACQSYCFVRTKTLSPFFSTQSTDTEAAVVPLCASTIFTIEYNFNTAQVVRFLVASQTMLSTYADIRAINQGLTNLGSLLGIVLAILVTGRPGDWAIVWMSQRNRGIYEPEYRLVFMLSMLVGVFGYVGWAVGSDHHIPWIGPVACITYVLSFCSSSTIF